MRGWRTVDPIELACSIDGRWLPHLAAMLHSLLSVEPSPVRVHVLAADLEPDDAEALTDMVAALGGELRYHRPDTDAVAGLPEAIAPTLWYRVFIAETLNDLDRVISVDTDVIMCAPIRTLWTTRLRRRDLLAAVPTVFPGSDWAERHCGPLGLRPQQYFNNGVAVLNLERMRQQRISARIVEFIDRHRELVPPAGLRDASADEFVAYARDHPERMVIPEQDATNAAVAGRWRRLHPRWNCMLQVALRPWSDEVFGTRAVEEALQDPAIRHFEGPGAAKPWHPEAESSAAMLYRRHRDRTPWPIEAEAAG